ncbi:hypothetical protein AB1Y20_008958 [Prymnesium parvum]|uniref:F-actin-capping protein subunit alpha n=1 Tax=Prymnesium parvum TaxID=97485 RepID=A0AB34K013_PRYPA|mmetsp:Transcript_34912/g.86832  ORF Transcript_34912/g.86832 Transcript_34912/m.86832 type:complete len:294 (-) Transcript_34912:444-1325(-)
MGDESELTDAQKLTLAKNFILQSPPAQQLKVVEDVRALVGTSVLTQQHELSMLKMLNTKEFAAVSLPSGEKILLTPHGELPDGTFLDPSSKQVVSVDHVKLACVNVQPMDAALLKTVEAAAQLRDPIDAAMRAHVEEVLPTGAVTTYGSSSASGMEIICCVAVLNSELANYCAGRWWGEWKLSCSKGGNVGQLTGTIKCNVHFFEEGNVQLTDGGTFHAELPLTGDVGEAFAKKIALFEIEFLTKLEEIYATLSEQVIQSLRRRLPITRTKFDWEKHTVAKLAMDLQTQAGLR